LRRLLPSNDTLCDVLIKASTIDKLYSTRAGNIYWVTDAIMAALEESESRRNGITAVEIVDLVSFHKQRLYPDSHRCASFASKYCHFFVPGWEFPIYDSFALWAVNNVLGKPQKGLPGTLSEYGDFCERVARLRKRDGMLDVGVKELDQFLWLWGQWLAQNGNEKHVIGEEVRKVLFESTDPDTQRHVRALEPKEP
jgi:hypothetical protein